jgi:hypothetical protein
VQNIIAALLVLSLVILPGPVSAQAQTQTTRTDYPITVDETNPCNGEMVQLTGTGHLVMHFTFDNAGGIHIVDITNTMGPLRGVALLSGTVYQANQTVSSTVNDNGQTPQFEFTFVMSETLISQGATPNFVAHTTVHATVSSNALVTANVLNIKTECSGQ